MKNLIPVLACTLAVLFTAPGVFALVDPDLDVILSGQSPLPVEPGKNVELEVYIQNNGYGEALETVVEIQPEYPFTLIVGNRAKKYLNIGPKSSVKSSYTLYVDDSAVTNTYKVKFHVYSNRTPVVAVVGNIPVSVQGDPKLILTDVQVSPSEIEPGSTVDIRARIKNVGTGKARHMEVKLNSSSSYLVPVLSKGSVYIDELGPGEEADMDFEINIDVSADYRTYITSLTVNYRDENSTERKAIFDLGVPVRGTVNLDIIAIEANYERGKLRIEVANKGTSEAKSLEAKLTINGETIGIDYLTSLKANKQTIFDFPLVYKGSGQLVIDYIGPGIEKNQAAEDIVLNFTEPKGGNGSALGVVIFIIIVVAVFLYFRRFRKRKS